VTVVDYIALTLQGDSLDPADVTHQLGVQPSQAFAKGDVTVHPLPTKFGYWRLRIDSPVGEVNACLSELLDTLRDRENVLAALAQTYETTITVVADLSGENEGEINIIPALLARIANAHAVLRFYWLYSDVNHELSDIE